MTNADKIRSMTDGQIAKLLHDIKYCYSTKTMSPCRNCPLKELPDCSLEDIKQWCGKELSDGGKKEKIPSDIPRD